jgi:hypothetical protein
VDEADLEALRVIPDPLERARRANLAMPEVEQIRNDAITEASHGTPPATIADTLGISRARISQILKGGPGPERAFWGASAGRITVALGEKPEAGRQPGSAGILVAVEDLCAYTMLSAFAAESGITASQEAIPAPGFVSLNRAGLIVICGPRLSPMIGQILESDQVLAFGHDAGGWFITDRRTATTWRSPMNQEENSDIAYLGRLSRPDGQGTFLYIAGIHAAGAPGVIHYLSSNLDQAWQRVRDRRFSALIRCTFEKNPFRITGSELLTDFYEGS